MQTSLSEVYSPTDWETFILFVFKYYNFFLDFLNEFLGRLHCGIIDRRFDLLLPVGISFYTFQALGYIIDVRRRDIQPERNFFKYALYVSFFPQLVAGPIERAESLLAQLKFEKSLKTVKIREGILLILWGYFLKVVIADRAAILIDTVYGNISTYGGMFAVVATVLFAFQIYCDFYGYSIIAKGAALILGIELMNNFKSPYLSTSVAEFWHRWHISLSSWFRDYLYVPLGGNRKGRLRKYVNLMIVFLTSGLWHGADWSFVAWGGCNGAFQIFGELSKKIRKSCNKIAGFDENTLSHRLFQIFVTFVFVDFTWIFFRASSFRDAIEVIQSILTVHNPWILFDGSLYQLGIGQKEISLLIYALMLLIFIDIMNDRNIRIRDVILNQEWWFQALFITVSILFILIFGSWGPGYNSASFIYFQF